MSAGSLSEQLRVLYTRSRERIAALPDVIDDEPIPRKRRELTEELFLLRAVSGSVGSTLQALERAQFELVPLRETESALLAAKKVLTKRLPSATGHDYSGIELSLEWIESGWPSHISSVVAPRMPAELEAELGPVAPRARPLCFLGPQISEAERQLKKEEEKAERSLAQS